MSRILLVADDRDVRLLIEDALLDADYEVDPTRRLSVGSLSKAREINGLCVQLIRHCTKPLSDLGRIIGDASYFVRGHAQEGDRHLLRSG